ncbi:MAG: hypothetical protein E7270_00225 [Lachnospiraceae bacterium]|nr:hypothetical protein [Lachnospiraceae bacterium]
MSSKNILKYVLSFVLMVLAIGITGNVKADELDYIEKELFTQELAQYSDDISEVVQMYLDEARDYATDDCPYKIIIPEGTYNIDKGFRIYSNTYLYMEGVTLNRVSGSGIFIRSGLWTDKLSGYEGYRNITIEGGTLNGNCDKEDYKSNNGSFIKMAHCKNVTLKNVTMKNGMDLHYVEVAGIDGFTMSGCKIQGLDNESTADNSKKEIEAVQFDVLHDESRMANFGEYDDTPMKNVSITKCTFSNVQKGIGSHSMVVGVYFENVSICENTFTNTSKEAISIEGYRNITIKDNTITNCGGGIEVKSMHSVEGLQVGDSKIYMPNKSSMGKINPDINAVISNNKITVKKTKYQSIPSAITLFGENIDAATAKYAKITAGDYYMENVDVKNNTISTPVIGIKLGNARKCNITDNNITYTGSASDSTNHDICIYDNSTNAYIYNNTLNKAGRHGIYVSTGCNNTTIVSNTVKDAYQTGIRVTNCPTNVVAKNNTLSGNVAGAIVYENKTKGTIEGNTISNDKKIGITIDTGSQATINKNTISNCAIDGISVKNSSTSTITSNTIKSSIRYAIDIAPGVKNAIIKSNAISLSGKEAIFFEKNTTGTIESNAIADTVKNAISVEAGANVTIKKNTITKAKLDGISVKAQGMATINGNTIRNSGRYGIDMAPGSKKSVIKNNTIAVSGKDGIFFEKNSSGTVEGNTVNDCKKNAISIDEGANVTIKKNTITKAKLDGISVKAQGMATISDNTIKNSGRYGIDMAKGSGKVSISYNKISKSKKCDIHTITSKSISLTKFGPLKVTKKKVAKKYITIKYSATKGATRYYIYRKTGNGGWKKIGYSTTTSYKDKGFRKGKNYQYKVLPYIKAGKSTIYGVMSNPLVIK